jgi:hypothetical protein
MVIYIVCSGKASICMKSKLINKNIWDFEVIYELIAYILMK